MAQGGRLQHRSQLASGYTYLYWWKYDKQLEVGNQGSDTVNQVTRHVAGSPVAGNPAGIGRGPAKNEITPWALWAGSSNK